MATSFGLDPVLNGSGVPVAGTTAQDIRQGLLDGLYDSQGVIFGFDVTKVTNTMNYSISAGSAVIYVNGGHTATPGYGATVTAPTGLTKHHVIVTQKNTSTDKSIQYSVQGACNNSDGNICIAEFDVPAGATNLNGAKESATKFTNYAAMRLAAGRILKHGWLPANASGYMKNNTGKLVVTHKMPKFGTRRLLRLDATYGIDKETNKKGEALYIDFKANGSVLHTFSTGLVDNLWTRNGTFSCMYTVEANTEVTLSATWRTNHSDGNRKSELYMRGTNTFFITDCGVDDGSRGI